MSEVREIEGDDGMKFEGTCYRCHNTFDAKHHIVEIRSATGIWLFCSTCMEHHKDQCYDLWTYQVQKEQRRGLLNLENTCYEVCPMCKGAGVVDSEG